MARPARMGRRRARPAGRVAPARPVSRGGAVINTEDPACVEDRGPPGYRIFHVGRIFRDLWDCGSCGDTCCWWVPGPGRRRGWALAGPACGPGCGPAPLRHLTAGARPACSARRPAARGEGPDLESSGQWIPGAANPLPAVSLLTRGLVTRARMMPRVVSVMVAQMVTRPLSCRYRQSMSRAHAWLAKAGYPVAVGLANTIKDCGAKAPPLPGQGDVDPMFGIENQRGRQGTLAGRQACPTTATHACSRAGNRPGIPSRPLGLPPLTNQLST